MTIKQLAESTMESLADNRQSVEEFLKAFIAEAQYQSARAHKEADDYTVEELEYWQQVGEEAQPVQDTKVRDAAVNLLWAIDKCHYLTTGMEAQDSAFTKALRAAVGPLRITAHAKVA